MERVVLLTTDINEESVNDIIEQLIEYNQEDSYGIQNIVDYECEPIYLMINSFGGQCHAGFGLISVIKETYAPIHAMILKSAYSMAVPIALSCDTIIMYEYSDMMIHELSYSMYHNTLTDHKQYSEQSQIEQDAINNIIINNSNITLEKLNSIYNTKTDWYISAKECKELGIVDEIRE